jgi:DNA modification methylase
MLVKAAAKENDIVQILFGGSGAELVLCKNLKRKFVSSEPHKPYYDIIVDCLNNDGVIKQDYQLRPRRTVRTNDPRLELFDTKNLPVTGDSSPSARD